jgi:hypothetical protein
VVSPTGSQNDKQTHLFAQVHLFVVSRFARWSVRGFHGPNRIGVTSSYGRATNPNTMNRFAFLAVVLVCFTMLVSEARSQDYPALSEATAIVTGTRQDTRGEALARELRDVLVKRSGNPALLHDPRVDPLAATAGDMVEDFLYLDRLSDQPKHDEQGTRDRPYTLIGRFSPAKIDAALAALGDHPWLAARPKLVVRIMITDKRSSFPLTADGDNDERHRQALLAASIRYGMHLVLMPADKMNDDASIPDSLVVTGRLKWSDSDPGWVGQWHANGDRDWGIGGVSFDEAFRNLVQGAIAIGSGHALPAARL